MKVSLATLSEKIASVPLLKHGGQARAVRALNHQARAVKALNLLQGARYIVIVYTEGRYAASRVFLLVPGDGNFCIKRQKTTLARVWR